MNELPVRQPATDRVGRSGRESSRSHAEIDRLTLAPVRLWNEPGPMSDRLSMAVAELVAALRDEVATERRQGQREPDRLLSIEQAARALGIGRTALYSEIGAGRIRSVKVGRRRLVPSSVIREVASRPE